MRTELHWAEGPWPGRLAIMARPRGGDWLEDEVRAWRRAGVDAIISLLTPAEVADLELSRESELCEREGIEFNALPVPDRGVPPSRQAVWELVERLGTMLAHGKNIAIHCRQGIGRAALLAACLLVAAGLDAETAFQRLSAVRGCPVPETLEQRMWVEGLARARRPTHHGDRDSRPSDMTISS